MEWLKKLGKGSLVIFYLLIALEVIIMISPFAAYYYLGYGPFLQRLYNFQKTAWLTAFFLPHSVITNSIFLESFRSLGRYLFSFGMIGFLILAIQVYSAKLRKKGVVSSGVYAYIRHPQYLCLAIAGLGLITIWPRLIIIPLFLTMLMVYYLLALDEERRMETAHPEYNDYRSRTAMFLPAEPGRWLYRYLFGWIKPKSLGLTACFVITLIAGIGIGMLLRMYTKAHISKLFLEDRNIIAISVWPKDPEEMEGIMELALNEDRVREKLERESTSSFSAHIMPRDYRMIGMFADVERSHEEHKKISLRRFRFLLTFLLPFLQKEGHHRLMGGKVEETRIVFSRLSYPSGRSVPLREALKAGVKMIPLFLVDMDVKKGRIIKVMQTPRRSFWGPIPMPIF